MKERHSTPQQQVVDYFNTRESRWGYRLLLKGTKHFGYYPAGREHLSTPEALELMEQELADRLALPRGSSVLDAGCGEGGPALYLAGKHGLRIQGIDLLERSVAVARRKAETLGLSGQVEFRIGDYSELEYSDGAYDGVYTMETLVHVSDYEKALAGFHRVLKPGGRLALFEYSLLPRAKMSARQKEVSDFIIEESAMLGLPSFVHEEYPNILSRARFCDVVVENITPRVLPMLKRFYTIAYYPYQLIKFFGLQRRFVNATSAVEWYRDIVEHDLWRYNIVSASKPD